MPPGPIGVIVQVAVLLVLIAKCPIFYFKMVERLQWEESTLLRVLLLCIMSGIAVIIPNIAQVIDFLGGVLGGFTCIIIPVLFFVTLKGDRLSAPRKFVEYLFCAVGVLLIVSGLAVGVGIPLPLPGCTGAAACDGGHHRALPF